MTKANERRKKGAMAAVLAMLTMLLTVGVFAPTANAAKVDNPNSATPVPVGESNFRMEVTGGYLQFVGSNGSPLQLPLDFAEQALPNPALVGTITTNPQGYGVINVPNQSFANCALSTTAGVCFPPIAVNVAGTADVTIYMQPVSAVTGFIDPLSGRVDLNMGLRLKIEGAAVGVPLGNSCFLGSASSPISLSTTNFTGSFPSTSNVAVADFVAADGFAGGFLAAEPYSDEAGQWAKEPKQVPGYTVGGAKPLPSQIPLNPLTDFLPRVAGSWRGINETLAAPAASNCGTSIVTDQLNSMLGLPSQSGASTASLDFKFAPFTNPAPGRTGANVMINKAVKSKFVAPGISASPWQGVDVPTAVSAQSISIDASTSYFKVGGNATERYRFDLGTGSFGAWSTNPVASFTAPILVEGQNPVDLSIRVQVKDVDGDTDTTTRRLRVVPATDISLDTSVSSVAGSGKLRAGSTGQVNFDVKNGSATDNSSLPIHFEASLPSGVAITSLNSPSGWTCTNDAQSISCDLPAGGLTAGEIGHFVAAVDVATGASNPSKITGSAVMQGDPSPGNNSVDEDIPVVKTDLSVALARTTDLVANGWTTYEVDVENVGDGLTAGNSTVSVALPSGLTYRANGSGGTGWVCTTPVNPSNISCVRSESIAGNSSAPVLTIVANVNRNTPAGDVTTSASVATQGDVNAFGGPDSADETGTVQVLPDVTVDASFAGGSYVVGDPGTMNLTVTNEAVVPIGGPSTVTVQMPEGLSIASLDGTNWDCSATPGDDSQIVCDYTEGLGAAETSPALTATFDVAQPAYPGVTFNASVENAQDGFALNNGDILDVQVRRLDVQIQKIAVRPFNVGIPGNYRLNVTNVGDAATVGAVAVLDELPGGLTLSSASGAGWDCSESTVGASHVECVLAGPLGPGVQAAPVNVIVNVLDAAAEAGILTNTAWVDTLRDTRGVEADEAVTGNNVSTIQTTAIAVDLSISSTHQGTFRVGTDDEYSLTVRNVGAFGTDPGEPVNVSFDLPEGITPIFPISYAGGQITRDGWVCGPDGNNVSCVLAAPDSSTAAMDSGSVVTIDIPVSISDAAADSSVAVAEVSTARDSNPTLSPNNIAEDATSVTRIDLKSGISETIPPRAGSIGEVAVEVDNIGSAATVNPTNVQVSLANGTAYRATGSTTQGWVCSSPGAGTYINCVRNQSVAAGGEAPPLKLRTNVSAGAPDSWNTQVSVSTTGEAVERQADNTASIEQVLEKVDLTVSKTHDPSGVKAGKRASFTIDVSNVGNHQSEGTITVTDPVNPTFSNVTASGSGWNCDVVSDNVSCARAGSAPIAAGEHAPLITVKFTIPAEASGTRDSTATVANAGDPYGANNTANDPIQIVAAADATVSIEQPGTVRVGNQVAFTYRVRNIGTEATSGSPSVKMRIAIAEGLELLSTDSPDGWECDVNDAPDQLVQSMDCVLPDSIDPNGSAVLTANYDVVSSVDPQTGTSARVNTAGDLNRSNDLALRMSDLIGFDLETAVSVPAGDTDGGALVAGTTKNRIVKVTNVGTTGTTAPVKVNADLPAGVQWMSGVAPGSDWTCSPTGTGVSCTLTGGLAAGASAPDLTLGLRASRANAPQVSITYVASTPGDDNPSNDFATRVDTVRYFPETTITSAPSGETLSKSGTVEFTSDDNGADFMCRVDGSPFDSCESPLSVSGLSIGTHVVEVKAVNEFGMEDATPAKASWSVKAEQPTGSSKSVKATLTGGSLSLASLGSVDLPAGQLEMTGSLYENGAFLVPASGVNFKSVTQAIPDALGPGVNVEVTISISATGDGLGTLTPGGGAASFVLPVRADIVANVGGSPLFPAGTECALTPVTFDMSGTWDGTAKTVSVSQPNVAFPTVTGCGSFGGAVNSLLELPRNDIAIALNMQLEDLACPAGQVGEPGSCVDAKVNLAKPKVTVSKKKVKGGKKVKVTAKITNGGTAAASNVKVCLQTPKALIKGKAKRCVTVKSIAAGKTANVRFNIATKKVKKSRKGSITVISPTGESMTNGKVKSQITVLK